MNPPAGPQWQGHKTQGGMTVMVTVQPVGWIGDWHENPKPQWIIPLSGRWFVESMDGERVEMGPGEISFGDDQNTREVERPARSLVGHHRRRAGGADGGAIRHAPGERTLPVPVSGAVTEAGMDGFEIKDRRFGHYILATRRSRNSPPAFAGSKGRSGWATANCLLFQDLPRNRTMRWTEDEGVSIYRAPSAYANGQTRDRARPAHRLLASRRCLYAHRA